jgi:hypothetical protein
LIAFRPTCTGAVAKLDQTTDKQPSPRPVAGLATVIDLGNYNHHWPQEPRASVRTATTVKAGHEQRLNQPLPRGCGVPNVGVGGGP